MTGGNLNNLINNPRLNPVVVSSIITSLMPNWNQCLQNAIKINSKFKWYVLGIVLSAFPKFILYIIRLLLGLTLSSLGILYSEFFNTIPFLKNLSTYFLSIVEEYSNFKFIRPVSIMEPTTINQPVDINNNHLNIYSVLGLLVFGFFTVTASIVFIDRWNPDFWSGVPLIQSFAESINNYINYFSSYFSKDNTTSSINPSPNPISPTSSIGSDRTVTPGTPRFEAPRFDLPITPPQSPEPGINPWD